MYEKKIPEDLNCGIVVAMKVFGAKWKPCIIDAINRGIRRPSEIHREITTASPRVIDMQLRELESFGVLFKIVHAGLPLKVTYYLTELGESILPIIDSLNSWGYKNRHIVQHNPAEAVSSVENEGENTLASEPLCIGKMRLGQ